MLLALYRVLKAQGKGVAEIGQIAIEILDRIHAYPKLLRRLLGRGLLSRFGKSRLKKIAEDSQKRLYPGGWVELREAMDGIYKGVEARWTAWIFEMVGTRGDEMHIEILGAESLGVRGLSCVVEVENRRIVIDPGVALGYQRYGLLPHPAQVAIGEHVRRKILAELKNATDVVMSHFHGDHVPLPNANPYQLKAQEVAPLCQTARFWAKGPEGLSHNMVRRRESLCQVLGRDLPNAEGQEDRPLAFSPPVPHGELGSHLGAVMMTRIESENTVFVHASDIQLLNGEAVSLILAWRPDIVLVGGPPLYLACVSSKRRKEAWENAQRLARHVDTLILDHHLLRCEEGLSWLGRLSSKTGHRVICAADFMQCPRCLLEARRMQLYEEMPVPEGWHEAYARGDADTCHYRNYKNEEETDVPSPV